MQGCCFSEYGLRLIAKLNKGYDSTLLKWLRFGVGLEYNKSLLLASGGTDRSSFLHVKIYM